MGPQGPGPCRVLGTQQVLGKCVLNQEGTRSGVPCMGTLSSVLRAGQALNLGKAAGSEVWG